MLLCELYWFTWVHISEYIFRILKSWVCHIQQFLLYYFVSVVVFLRSSVLFVEYEIREDSYRFSSISTSMMIHFFHHFFVLKYSYTIDTYLYAMKKCHHVKNSTHEYYNLCYKQQLTSFQRENCPFFSINKEYFA